MDYDLLRNSLNPLNALQVIKYNIDFRADHPDYFDPSGLLVFCGSQGSGKTLSAVSYVKKLCETYHKAILVTNVDIKGLPEWTQVIEYNGLDCLKDISNGYYGVIYLIDEIHLEFNSLESKNIPIEVMVEISQQRKQRKHIVGTTQIYGRMAKPLREQIKNVILCRNILGLFQFNTLIDGDKTVEKDGHLITESCKRLFWFHSPKMYTCYDTFAKMKRYRKEWQGRSIV